MADNVVCLECKAPFKNEKELHKHLRSHKIKVADYFLKHYPRTDKWSGEPIPFKSQEQYLETDFLSRGNMVKFLTQKATPKEAMDYAVSLLARRKEKKKLRLAPGHVELRSLLIPSITYFESVGDYNETCRALGLKQRYDYKQALDAREQPKGFKIFVDTREQEPLKFHVPTMPNKLSVGDYAGNTEQVAYLTFERKSLEDLVSSISQDYDRIKSELTRADTLGLYPIFIVERPMKDALAIENLANIHSAARGTFIFNRIRELLNTFECQFVFCKNREQCATVIERILQLKNDVRTVDLQLELERGKLLNVV